MAESDLNGRRVLVTGATSGLGRAMAAALVQAGARVALTSRERGRAEAVADELGAGALGVELDVRDAASISAGVDRADELLGGLDMIENGRGRMVTISMSEPTMVRRGFVPYGPAGAAVGALAKVMAADLAQTPVTANIRLPGGATDTGMIPEDMPDEARAGLLDPAIMGPPILWLASARAAGVHGERIVAREFEVWLAAHENDARSPPRLVISGRPDPGRTCCWPEPASADRPRGSAGCG